MSEGILNWVNNTYELAIKSVTEQALKIFQSFSTETVATTQLFLNYFSVVIVGMFFSYIFCYGLYQIALAKHYIDLN